MYIFRFPMKIHNEDYDNFSLENGRYENEQLMDFPINNILVALRIYLRILHMLIMLLQKL